MMIDDKVYTQAEVDKMREDFMKQFDCQLEGQRRRLTRKSKKLSALLELIRAILEDEE